MLIPRIEVLAYVMQKGIISTEKNISLRNSILKLRAVRNQESSVSYGGSSLTSWQVRTCKDGSTLTGLHSGSLQTEGLFSLNLSAFRNNGTVITAYAPR